MKKLFLQDGKLMVGEFSEEPNEKYFSGDQWKEKNARVQYQAAVSAAKASAVEVVDMAHGFYKALLNSQNIATGEGSEQEVLFALNSLQEGQLYDTPEGWTVEMCRQEETGPGDDQYAATKARLIPLKEQSGIVATGLPESESILYGLSGMAFKEAGILESGETLNGPFNTHPARNFPEDYEQENGNYINTCSVCKLPFRGNKHRVWCRMCDEPNWEELSKIQKPEINSPPMAGCWLEGEMVGFARCMVKRVKPLQEEIARLKSVSPPPQAESQEGLIRDLLSNYTRSWLEVKSMSPEEDALIGRIADKFTITRKP